MAKAFEVPNKESYTKVYSNLVDESKVLMAAACISQCTGCKCSCNKGIEDFEIEW